jgi:hypothetical protein
MIPGDNSGPRRGLVRGGAIRTTEDPKATEIQSAQSAPISGATDGEDFQALKAHVDALNLIWWYLHDTGND